jgi:16S rRNA (guanine527-N7)-methyltransferase
MNNISLLLKYFPDLSEEAQQKFSLLLSLYEEWNSKINVISRKDMEFFMERHVLHSLSLAKAATFKPGAIQLDLGTGGGFPGIPLAILMPDVPFLLVDSIAKKIKVVEEVAQALELKNVSIVCGRAETQKVVVDRVITRAVAPLPQLIEWTKPFAKTNPRFRGILALKGGDLKDEIRGIQPKPSITPISKWFEEAFFETKSVVRYG